MKRTGLVLIIALLAALPAGAQGAADPLSADARLRQKITLRSPDTTVRDLLADIEGRTGVRFFGDPALGETRVSLFTHDRPAAEALHQLGEFCGLTWKRVGTGDTAGFTVASAPAAARAAESAESVKRMLNQELAAYVELRDLPEKRLKERRTELARQVADEVDSAKQQDGRLKVAVADNLLADSASWRLVYGFLDLLNVTDRVALVGGGRTAYGYPSADRGHLLPSSVMRDDDDSGLDRRADGGSYLTADLQLASEAGPDPRIVWTLTAVRRSGYSSVTIASVGTLPSVPAPAEGAPEPDAPPDWRSEAALTAAAPALPAPPGAAGYSLGQVLEALDAAQPLDIVADAFRVYRVAPEEIGTGTVGELLTRMARLTGHRWWRQEGFTLLRSRAFGLDLAAEPPSAQVARWQERAERGDLDLPDFVDIAMLPDAQFTMLMRLTSAHVLSYEISRTMQARRPLRIYGALTNAQRGATTAGGVKYSELTASQQELWKRLLNDAGVVDRRVTELGPGHPITTLISSSSLQITREELPAWGAFGHRWFIAVQSTPDRGQAYMALKEYDTTLKTADLKQMTLVTIQFIFDAGTARLGIGRLAFPISRIEEPASGG